MRGKIGFDDLRIDCIIGDLPEEREAEQSLFVDLRVEGDFSKCARSDDVRDTVDYVALADLCTKLAVERRYRMLETFAVEVIEHLRKQDGIFSVWIRIKKPKALSFAALSVIELQKNFEE